MKYSFNSLSLLMLHKRLHSVPNGPFQLFVIDMSTSLTTELIIVAKRNPHGFPDHSDTTTDLADLMKPWANFAPLQRSSG